MMIKRKASVSKNVDQLPTQEELEEEDCLEESEVVEEMCKKQLPSRKNVGARRPSGADIHPELTMDKIQSQRGILTSFGSRSSRDSRGSRRSSELSFSTKEVLELNTMYEYGQEKQRKRRSRPRKREGARRSTWEAGSRRSSISVLTLTVKKTEKRKKRYFARSDVTPQPQSRTAVHYLVMKFLKSLWKLLNLISRPFLHQELG